MDFGLAGTITAGQESRRKIRCGHDQSITGSRAMAGLVDDLDFPAVAAVRRLPWQAASPVRREASRPGGPDRAALRVTQPDRRGVQRSVHRRGLAAPAAVVRQHKLPGVESPCDFQGRFRVQPADHVSRRAAA